MKIHIIQAGGSIDKDYPEKVKGYEFLITDPCIHRVLKYVHPAFEYEVSEVLKKDSLDMTDEDRQLILDACKKSGEEKILVTHGTDTMIETAKVLGEIQDKTVVLTGSYLPQLFKNTDAEFNLGVAIGALNVLDHGVYIAMNGQVYPYDNVKKDQQTGQFQPL